MKVKSNFGLLNQVNPIKMGGGGKKILCIIKN